LGIVLFLRCRPQGDYIKAKAFLQKKGGGKIIGIAAALNAWSKLKEYRSASQ